MCERKDQDLIHRESLDEYDMKIYCINNNDYCYVLAPEHQSTAGILNKMNLKFICDSESKNSGP